MAHAYLLLETDWFYNDEFYVNLYPDGMCTHPVQVFATEAEARNQLNTRTGQRLPGLHLGFYGDTVKEISSLQENEFFARLSGILNQPELLENPRLFDLELPERLTEDQTRELLLLLDRLHFYRLVPATTHDRAALQQAAGRINGGVRQQVTQEHPEYGSYTTLEYLHPAEEIQQAVACFGLDFEEHIDF